MGFITRIAKGVKLTWQELDENFTKIVGAYIEGRNIVSPDIDGPGTISLIGNDAVINGVGTAFMSGGFTEFYIQEGQEVIVLIIEQEFTASNQLAYISAQYNLTTDPARTNNMGPQWNYADVVNRSYFYAKNVKDNNDFNIITGFGNAVTSTTTKAYNYVSGFYNGLADSFESVVVGTRNNINAAKNIVVGVGNSGRDGSGNSLIVGRNNNNQGGDNYIIGEQNRSFLSSMQNFIFAKNTELYASFSAALATRNVIHRGGGSAAVSCNDVTIPENWTNSTVIGFNQNEINDYFTYHKYVIVPRLVIHNAGSYADDLEAAAAGLQNGTVFVDSNGFLRLKQ